jgi:hypothetical protein
MKGNKNRLGCRRQFFFSHFFVGNFVGNSRGENRALDKVFDKVFDKGGAFVCLLIVHCFLTYSSLGASRNLPSPISVGPDGRLVYVAETRGDRIPDFSHCGYAGGGRPIPAPLVRVVVSPVEGDNTARIQRAIDHVGSLPADTNGLRGAVLLLKGRYEIFGALNLNASGVVLRGQGMDEAGTVLVASGLDRRTFIRITGQNEHPEPAAKKTQVKDEYVPVGATSFHVAKPSGLKGGDNILITRPSTQAWIERLGMTEFGGGIGDWRLVWKPGSRDIRWDRVIKSVEGDLITVDAPITTAIEKEFGGGHVEQQVWPGRIENVGIENLRCESSFDPSNPKDENHSWFAITMENAKDCWVRQFTAKHFAGSMVAIYESCKRVTVQDCLSLAPVSEEGGYRRHTFFTMGQLTLFLRCYAERGRHDFSVGHCAAGPNAFVQCSSSGALGDSGPLESWASGVLYDGVTVDGSGLSLANRGAGPTGAGWAAANSVLWQCSAAFIRCANPPTARNWAFGSWAEFEGDGIWRSSNEFVKPDSLYVAQVADQLGPEIAARIKLMRRATEERTNPTLDEAAQLIAASKKPGPLLCDFISAAPTRDPIPSEPGDAKMIEPLSLTPGFSQVTAGPRTNSAASAASTILITNGWLTIGGRLLIGPRTNVAWWRGNIRPGEAQSADPCLVRFVPGRTGPGFTDDLTELATMVSARGVAALDHHYGLWYERRRDDHERVRRANGDVWPPFYELPFARSGQGTAWDGLSRYDLTEPNPWYWTRLEAFASLCDGSGLVLFHENYFQHNIVEAGAHWADFPWRSANNINNTGFPEPPPYAGDKRIFMAEQFYDITHPVRRRLHRAYIRQCLNNFATNSNVIQFTSAEFTGPLHFVQFWLDTIAEWESETGRHPFIALSCTKDVQDAILADPKRSRIVSLIDFKYWWQTAKGLYAPKGGQTLAPRQFERQWRGGRPTDNDLAVMTAEYRQKYFDKPVICDFPQGGWAYVCTGGSMPNLPRGTDEALLAAIPRMRPWPDAGAKDRWVLRETGRQCLVYLAGPSRDLDLGSEKGSFTVRSVNFKTGQTTVVPGKISTGRKATLPDVSGFPAILWLTQP